MNSFVTEKQFWAEFIELYRQNECLWRIRSKDYINKRKKNEAYELLAEKLKEKDSDATIETVKKRINNMRSVFRKEMKKVSESIRSGASAADVYAPQLWYYSLLLFLKDQETPRKSATNMDEVSNVG